MKEYQTIILDDGTACRVKIVFDSRIQKILRALKVSKDAQTTWTTIRYFCPKDARLSTTSIIHELEHVRQWKRYGFFGFLWRYYSQLARYGYNKHPLEQEARRAAGEPLR